MSDDLISQGLVAGRPSPTSGAAAACDGDRALAVLAEIDKNWDGYGDGEFGPDDPEGVAALARAHELVTGLRTCRYCGHEERDHERAPEDPATVPCERCSCEDFSDAFAHWTPPARTVAGQADASPPSAAATVDPRLLKSEPTSETQGSEEAARGAGVERRVAILTRIVEEQDKLLACFRLGKNPGAIIDRLRKARERLASLAPASTTRKPRHD